MFTATAPLLTTGCCCAPGGPISQRCVVHYVCRCHLHGLFCPVHSPPQKQRVTVMASRDLYQDWCWNVYGPRDERVLAIFLFLLVLAGALCFFFIPFSYPTTRMFRTNGQFSLFGENFADQGLYAGSFFIFLALAAAERLLYYKVETHKLRFLVGTNTSDHVLWESFINALHDVCYVVFWFFAFTSATGNIIFVVGILVGRFLSNLALFPEHLRRGRGFNHDVKEVMLMRE